MASAHTVFSGKQWMFIPKQCSLELCDLNIWKTPLSPCLHMEPSMHAMFVCLTKHAYVHTHPHAVDPQRSNQHMCVPLRHWEDRIRSHGVGVWGSRKGSIESGGLATLERHTLGSLSSGSLEPFSEHDRRSGGHCAESETVGSLICDCCLSSSSYTAPLFVSVCVLSSCCAHVQLEGACRWRNSLLAQTPSLSVWQICNICWTLYVNACMVLSPGEQETPVMNLQYECVCFPWTR